MCETNFTWFLLREAINKMSDEELRQPVQVVPGMADETKPVGLMPIIGIDTIENWEIENTRDSHDCQHHPETVVLLSDGHPYGDNGEFAYDLDGNVAMWAPGFGPESK